MAEATIELRRGPDGGHRIVVRLRSDCDMLPYEHEQLHRRIVDELLEGGAIERSECGDRIHIERERPAKEPVLG